MIFEEILRVKNLPQELSDVEKEELLHHFGATHVKVVNFSSKQKSIAYAKFQSKEVAKTVLQRLHQLSVLNSRLCVEYSETDITDKRPVLKQVDETDNSSKNFFKNFVCKLNSFNHAVGFQQPPPAHLKYAYPKPNRPTINNIAHALATIPKFYTQVLHLMNRMNLPPPFAMLDPSQMRPTISNQPQTSTLHQPKIQSQPAEVSTKSSSESELESDEEDLNRKDQIIPQKRKIGQKKVIKRPKFIKPNTRRQVPTKSAEKTEDVFEKLDVHLQKKIELKVSSNSLLNIEKNNKDENLTVIPNNELEIKDTTKKLSTIPEEELKSNQIPLKDLGVLPIFKDYHPGVPSIKLYIKNIAKNVELKDLEYIFNRYKVDVCGGKEELFNIRLMQEGRMKGQAFVTLENIEIAQKALNETNGFILKDKPLVVVFARVPSARNS